MLWRVLSTVISISHLSASNLSWLTWISERDPIPSKSTFLVMHALENNALNSPIAFSTLCLPPVTQTLTVSLLDGCAAFILPELPCEAVILGGNGYFCCSCRNACVICFRNTTMRTVEILVKWPPMLLKAWKITWADSSTERPKPPAPKAGIEMDLMPFASARRRPFSRHDWRCCSSAVAATMWIMCFAINVPPLVITAEPGAWVPFRFSSCCTCGPHVCAIVLLSWPKFFMFRSVPTTFTIASLFSWVKLPFTTSTLIGLSNKERVVKDGIGGNDDFCCSLRNACTIWVWNTTIRTVEILSKFSPMLFKAWKISWADSEADRPKPPVPMAGTEMDRMTFASARRRPFSRHVWRCCLSAVAATKWIMCLAINVPPLVITAEPGVWVPFWFNCCCTCGPQLWAITRLSCPKLFMFRSAPMTFTMASLDSLVKSPVTKSTLTGLLNMEGEATAVKGVNNDFLWCCCWKAFIILAWNTTMRTFEIFPKFPPRFFKAWKIIWADSAAERP